MKHEYHATIQWNSHGTDFINGKYSRAHQWSFDCGITLEASASPQVVPLPFSKEYAIDPEESYVASISSCHMLTFLYLASREKIDVERYIDHALGWMETTPDGKTWVTRVILRPQIIYRGTPPSVKEIEVLHHAAHEECYIANSVKTDIRIETPKT